MIWPGLPCHAAAAIAAIPRHHRLPQPRVTMISVVIVVLGLCYVCGCVVVVCVVLCCVLCCDVCCGGSIMR